MTVTATRLDTAATVTAALESLTESVAFLAGDDHAQPHLVAGTANRFGALLVIDSNTPGGFHATGADFDELIEAVQDACVDAGVEFVVESFDLGASPKRMVGVIEVPRCDCGTRVRVADRCTGCGASDRPTFPI